MEYQVLIYCIIDSVMMPPAVPPPVLSAESRVAAHGSTARLPPRGALKNKHIPIKQSKTSRTGSGGENPPAYTARDARTLPRAGKDAAVVLEVRPSGPRRHPPSPLLRVTVMKRLGRAVLAPR